MSLRVKAPKVSVAFVGADDTAVSYTSSNEIPEWLKDRPTGMTKSQAMMKAADSSKRAFEEAKDKGLDLAQEAITDRILTKSQAMMVAAEDASKIIRANNASASVKRATDTTEAAPVMAA